MVIIVCAFAYLLVGLVCTVVNMKLDDAACRDWWGDADPMAMLFSTTAWPFVLLLAMFSGIIKLFKL